MTVKIVPVSQIDRPDPIFRRFSEVEREFLELVDQIRDYGGPLQAPPARPRPNGRYQLIDGNRRLTGTIKAGLSTMPLRIVDLDDKDYLAAQMACNDLHKDTDWFCYAEHLERLRLMGDEEMTLGDLAAACKRSTAWVRRMLNLKHLDRKYAEAVRRNELPVGNAVYLARIPFAEQGQYVNDAMVMPTKQFAKKMQRVLNDYRESLSQGKLAKLGKDDMRPRMRDFREIQSELETPSQLPLMIASQQITCPVEAANLALQWAFRVDADTLEERRQKVVSRELGIIKDAERRKADRERLRKSG